MKHIRGIAAVLLVVLAAAGWASCLLDASGDTSKSDYEHALELAEDRMSRGLYQLAIYEYENAIALQDSEDLWDAMFHAYALRYEESAQIRNSYLSAAERAVAAHPDNAEYYVILAGLYMDQDNDQSAYKCLSRAVNRGVKDARIEEMLLQVKYAFQTDWFTYSDFLPYCNGSYAVMNSELWGYIDASGGTDVSCSYSLASRAGDGGIRVLAGEEACLLVDQKDVTQGKLSFVPETMGVYAEGLIPLGDGETVSYYDSLGDRQFGGYRNAGSFQDGTAAVELSQGVWKIMDRQAQEVSRNTYQEIRLNADGTYRKNGVMLAKTDGFFRLYDQDENAVGTFSCEEIDVVVDEGPIAFERGGKWGFVNAQGEEVFAPVYEKAKSFSNGLAAVCTDGKWGFIDLNGRTAIEFQFLDADYFNPKKSCLVQINENDWQLISLKVDA